MLTDNEITFKTAICSTVGIKIQIPSMEVYRKTLRLLRQEDNFIQHHTFLPAEERDLHVVVRGTGFELPPEEVFQNLQALGFQPIKIMRMRHPITKAEMPLLLVILPKNAKSREIYNLKHICDIVIKVEALGISPVVGQCRRCLLFGHNHTQCFADYRCRHCAGNHEITTCPNINGPKKCANCGANHRASFRGCDRAPIKRPPPTLGSQAPPRAPVPSLRNTKTFPSLPSSSQPAARNTQHPQNAPFSSSQPSRPSAAQVLKRGVNTQNKNQTSSNLNNQHQLLQQMQATMQSMAAMFTNMCQIMSNQ